MQDDGTSATALRLIQACTETRVVVPRGVLGRLRFKWNHYRYVWRIRLYYTALCAYSIVMCLCSWTYFLLARRIRCSSYTHCGVFKNYQCPKSMYYFNIYSVFAMSAVNFLVACFSLVEARTLNLFMHTTQYEVLHATSEGKKPRKMLAYMVMNVPWLIGWLSLLWLAMVLVAVGYVVTGACDERWRRPDGLQAVLNCRLYYVKCCDPSVAKCKSDIFNCNSLEFLTMHSFLERPIEYGSISEVCDIDTVVPSKNSAASLAGFWGGVADDLIEAPNRAPANALREETRSTDYCPSPYTYRECFINTLGHSHLRKMHFVFTCANAAGFAFFTVLLPIIK